MDNEFVTVCLFSRPTGWPHGREIRNYIIGSFKVSADLFEKIEGKQCYEAIKYIQDEELLKQCNRFPNWYIYREGTIITEQSYD